MNLIELHPPGAPVEVGSLDAMAARLAALSHPARLRILRHLSGRGACCCKEVVEQLDLAQSTVSQHLKVLVDVVKNEQASDADRVHAAEVVLTYATIQPNGSRS